MQVDLNCKIYLVNEETREEELEKDVTEMAGMGKVPVMVRSMLCFLHIEEQRSNGDLDVSQFGECPYDQVCSHYCGTVPKRLLEFSKISSGVSVL